MAAFVLFGGMYRAPSESMVPTIEAGDRFAVLKLGQPDVGDVVVLHPATATRASSRAS